MAASTTSTLPTSQVSERKSGHSRESSRDKFNFARNGIPTPNGTSLPISHSRNSSWDSKKNDDPIPPRLTPPSISILPSSTPSTRRNSNDYGFSFSSVPISSYSHPNSPASSTLSWATDKLATSTQTSKKLLHRIGLSKLSTSFSYDSEKYAYPSDASNHYCSSPNEKAMYHYPKPAKYHSTFCSAPIGYAFFHLKRHLQSLLRPRRFFSLLISLLLLTYFFRSPLADFYRSSRFLGGGSKYVIILAANQGGGVLGWKGEKEWFVERESIKNKKAYAARHGYTLEIRDMKSMRRYAHEWREGWEKVDTLKRTMKKYPEAEWFWYLDIQTLIMQPELSLQQHIFERLGKITYRDINKHNPLNITHPPLRKDLDEVSRSRVGDGDESSISMLVPQDCSGFNLAAAVNIWTA
ncbi:hypothetical protein DRE_03698 [Drechslerella stenobrocha 248]|uniref:Uncharacterized protein n=1 Tax=Drechslerella stenobrocha 248 TaxID=1043628 RepID=W7HS67_9PEZI|nr:hypothetical protein DRE_03698 [Drechslerella stenobrocha 248]